MPTIILAGCGGGYDIMGTMPLYHRLKDHYDIILVNLSFTSRVMLRHLSDTTNYCSKIRDSFIVYPNNEPLNDAYFPEMQVANAINKPVYALVNYNTVQDIIDFYESIIKDDLISIYLVDCGCDVLLSGQETELGSYVEDMLHFKALIEIQKIKECELYVCAIGLNCDCGHGIIESELRSRLEELKTMNIIIKEEILDREDDDVKFYLETFMSGCTQHSIVHSFVTSALENERGFLVPKYANRRIKSNTTVNISDLTKTFIICKGLELSKTITYFDRITNTTTYDELDSFFL